MDERKQKENEPWEENSYRTGSTRPPKSRAGLIAVLLIAVILLCSVIGVMGQLNIKLFSRQQPEQPENPLSFHQGSENTLPSSGDNRATEPTQSTQPGETEMLEISPAPQGAENVPQPGGLSLQQIYENTIDSVVSISCTLAGGASSGTGVVISENGYIVTNCHVVEDARAVSVLFTDGTQLPARIVGTDPVSDLAVLQVSAQDLQPAQFGDSNALRVGDLAVAIGDPLGIEFRGTMTDGIISAINRDVTTNGRTMTLIQTNAALNSGNSGGPLLNCYGQVIGINTLKIGAFTDSAGVEGLGFAIPSTTVKEVVDQLMHQGYVSGRPTLGIQCRELTATERQFYRLPAGLLVTQVEEGGAADMIGMAAGDILVRLDETDTTDLDILTSVVLEHKVGDQLKAMIYRSGKYYTTTVTLAESRG